MIRPLGYNPRLKSSYHALMTGYLVNFGLPRLGEITRCVALGRKEKIPVDKLVGTVIAERAFDMLSLGIIALLMLIFRRDLISGFLNDYIFQPATHKLAGISAVPFIIAGSVILLVAIIVFYFLPLRRRLRQNALFMKISGFLKGIAQGLKSFYSMDNKAEFLFHTLFIWLNYAMMAWVVVFVIPATSGLGFVDAIFILVIGSLGMAAPVQGGIGAYHWIVSRGLLVVYGIPLDEGLAYATISHESQLLLIVILGFISFYFLVRNQISILSDPNTTTTDGQG